MTLILTSDSYRGYSAPLTAYSNAAPGAQPAFVGRLIWPGSDHPDDVVLKLYKSGTCGIANEVIGYSANIARGISQPKRSAITLLSMENLEVLGIDLSEYVDAASSLIPCWTTSFEQGAVPFKFIRRSALFSEKKAIAFYKSQFCQSLAAVDHITGNNDRHSGNYLYIDDLNYLAIDQGCVGGGLVWHKGWPDANPRNELRLSAARELTTIDMAEWSAKAIVEHHRTQGKWAEILPALRSNLDGLLDLDAIDIIVEYMEDRASGTNFATSCGSLF